MIRLSRYEKLVEHITDCDRDILEFAAARAAVFRLLARLWGEELSRDLAELLSRPPLVEVLHAIADFSMPSRVEDRDLQQWAVDYCQLFVGPRGHLPPYQSVWMDRRLAGEAAASMERFLQLLDYRPVWSQRLMADHLAIQLDVMAELLERSTRPDAFSREERRWLADLLINYFRQHLCWPQRLLDQVARRAITPLYRSLAKMTDEFLRQECELMLGSGPGFDVHGCDSHP